MTVGMIARAGEGDEIMLMQLYENMNWGETTSNPIADPNPRLEAVIEAARRGATVRLLLDKYFDDTEALRNNQGAVEYVRSVAANEALSGQLRTRSKLGGLDHEAFDEKSSLEDGHFGSHDGERAP